MSHNVFSIAILNQLIDPSTLESLSHALKKHFAYFEILLLNPTTSPAHKAAARGDYPPPQQHSSTPRGSIPHNSNPHSSSPTQPKPSTAQSHALDSLDSLLSIPNIRILHIATPASAPHKLGSLMYEVFLQNCIGDYLLFMNLTSDPIDRAIAMLKRAPEFDAIIGMRTSKPHTLTQRLASKAFYTTLRLFGVRGVNDNQSEFCLISRKLIHHLLHTQSDLKLLRLMHFDESSKILHFPYTPLAPTPKPFLASLHLGLDIIIGQSYRLLRLGSCACLLFALFNALYALYILLSYFLMPHIAQGWTSTSMYMVVMNIGLFLMLSIIGEYIRLILLRQKGSAPYEIIDEQSSVRLELDEKNIQRHSYEKA